MLQPQQDIKQEPQAIMIDAWELQLNATAAVMEFRCSRKARAQPANTAHLHSLGTGPLGRSTRARTPSGEQRSCIYAEGGGTAMASAATLRGRDSSSAPAVTHRDNVKRKHCALDLDTLNCPFCWEPLSLPVFQCQDGHATCACCCKKLPKGACPVCAKPIGANRCIVVEKIIESLQVNCKYTAWGCKEMLQYSQSKRDRKHEDMCVFRSYCCPLVGCNHQGPKQRLRQHFQMAHNGSLLEVLQPDDERKASFAMEGAYDKSCSQYVLLEALEYEDVNTDNERLFLIHDQFHEKLSRFSFSCTSFGASKTLTRYQLAVHFVKAGGFKENYAIEGPIHDNQEDRALLSKMVRHGDCLLVPKLFPAQKDGPLFAVDLSLL